jgi:hypothetical protein
MTFTPAELKSARAEVDFDERSIYLPFSFGARVVVDGNYGLAGAVVGYCVRKDYLDIEVAWFSNGDAKSGWFADWRVEAVP